MQLNKRAVRLWIEALRSGRYRQGVGALCRVVDGQETYCCLGVLCEVAIADGVDVVVDRLPSGDVSWLVKYDGSTSYLPVAVGEWLGSPSSRHGGVPMKNSPSALAANDGHGWSFHRIADALENTYLEGEEDV